MQIKAVGTTRSEEPVREAISFVDADWDRFSNAVEASFDVQSRSQFFVWTQSAVQGLVPQQILLCGIRDPNGSHMLIQHFSASRYFRQEHFEAVANPQRGLLPLLVTVARDTGEPIVFSPLEAPRASHQQLDAMVEANEMQNLAAKLMSGIGGQPEAFYGFARVSATFDERLRRLLELMVPHVHNTFIRVLAKEREATHASESRPSRIITPRQVEILRLVRDGKTNAEIAVLLECSQWTIKNHVQNILRRLDTNSRAHALVRAMQLGILRPD